MNVKNRKMIAAIALTFAAGLLMSRADTHYVSLDGTNNSPYTNGWADAATNIQWAVDAADAATFDTVLVSNGTFNLTNQINIISNITVQSVNGTNFTFINGNYPAYTNRCVFMNAGTLDGFTISNGFLTNSNTNYPNSGYPYALGGAGIGIRLGATVKNCYIYKNYITNYGGGGINAMVAPGLIISNCAVVSNTSSGTADKRGGGILLGYGGLVIDSYIYGNVANYGGGFYFAGGGLLTNCIIAGNHANIADGGGRLESYPVGVIGMANCVISNNTSAGEVGGVRADYHSGFINSTIIGNKALGNRGGVLIHTDSFMSNCQVIGNSAVHGGGVQLNGAADETNVVANCTIANNYASGSGGGLRIDNGGLVKNCLIYGNSNVNYGAGVYLVNNALYTNLPYGLINCTIVDNKGPAAANGAGIYANGGTNYIANCIVVSNVTFAGAQANIYNDTPANTNNYWHTCTPDVLPPNQGNITSDPLFVNRPDYNYRLRAGSPCINTGTNGSWTATDVDLDGRMRIRYVTVDMGAYEFIRSGTIFGFH